ncbi:MAG: mannose-1-phosphate guanylyltransferase/mannose-6-phosphate isomerase [Desulfobacteraceae bacterium]
MPDSKLKVYPILLAGGSGTRLWPVSREFYPKQLVKFIGQDSLVQATIKRLIPVLNKENVRIVCGKEHYHEIARHMAGVDIEPEDKIIAEPCGRNTAPAILLALLKILHTQPDAVVCIFPADHVIKENTLFNEKLEAAIALAEQDYIVTFGIKPNYPETGYGYIEGDEELSHGAFTLKRFVEKPNRETAQKYLEAGTFFWNAGMFTFKASVMLEEFIRLQPELYQQLFQLINSEKKLTKENYGSLPDISIDYAIMEHTDKGVVLPSDFGWSDIGSWKSLYDFLSKDVHQNVIDGDVITQNTHSCFVMGRDRLIAASGISNMVIVDTPDSVFVSDLENSRDVKSIVTELKEKGRREYQHHRTIYFSWGNVTALDRKDDFGVDRLEIYPGKTFEMKLESNHDCNITLVRGQVIVQEKDQQSVLNAGENLVVGYPGVLLKNQSDQPVILVQVTYGIVSY